MQSILLITVAMCLAPSLSWTQQPAPCKSPDLFVGSMKWAAQNEELYAVGKLAYDAINKRIHWTEMGTSEHKNFTYETLSLYQEGVVYEIHRHNQTCVKKVLQGDFRVIEVPKDASFMGQAVIGTLAYPGQGLVVNTWMGQGHGPEFDTYMVSFTESDCLPVSGFYKNKDMGWISQSYFDNMPGMPDPDAFVPPPFCQQAKLEDGKKVHFFHGIIH